jgi:hypothetical protein
MNTWYIQGKIVVYPGRFRGISREKWWYIQENRAVIRLLSMVSSSLELFLEQFIEGSVFCAYAPFTSP